MNGQNQPNSFQQKSQVVYQSQPVLYQNQNQNYGNRGRGGEGRGRGRGYQGRGGNHTSNRPPHHDGGSSQQYYQTQRGSGQNNYQVHRGANRGYRGRGNFRGHQSGPPHHHQGQFYPSNDQGYNQAPQCPPQQENYPGPNQYQNYPQQYQQPYHQNQPPHMTERVDVGGHPGSPPHFQPPQAPAYHHDGGQNYQQQHHGYPPQQYYGAPAPPQNNPAETLQQQYEQNQRDYQQYKKLQTNKQGSYDKQNNLAQLAANYAADQLGQPEQGNPQKAGNYGQQQQYGAPQQFQAPPATQGAAYPPAGPPTQLQMSNSISENYRKAQEAAAAGAANMAPQQYAGGYGRGGQQHRGNYRGNSNNYRGNGGRGFNPNHRGRGGFQNNRGQRGGGNFRERQNSRNEESYNQEQGQNSQQEYANSDVIAQPVEKKQTSPEEQEEIRLWIESRRRNWPSKQRLAQKEESQAQKQEIGLDDEAQPQRLSKIEMKLRRKLKIINKQEGKQKKKGERRQNDNTVLGKRPNPYNENNDFKGEQLSPETGATGPGQYHQPKKQQKQQKLKNGGAIIEKKGSKSLILNFRYRKNQILEQLVKNQQEKEMGIILQCFRFMVKNEIV